MEFITIITGLIPILIGLVVLGFMLSIPVCIVGLIAKMTTNEDIVFSIGWKMMVGCVTALFVIVSCWGLLSVIKQTIN